MCIKTHTQTRSDLTALQSWVKSEGRKKKEEDGLVLSLALHTGSSGVCVRTQVQHCPSIWPDQRASHSWWRLTSEKERCRGGSLRSEILIISTAECFLFSNTIILYQTKQHDCTRKSLTFTTSCSLTLILSLKRIDPNSLQIFFQTTKQKLQQQLAALFITHKCKMCDERKVFIL